MSLTFDNFVYNVSQSSLCWIDSLWGTLSFMNLDVNFQRDHVKMYTDRITPLFKTYGGPISVSDQQQVITVANKTLMICCSPACWTAYTHMYRYSETLHLMNTCTHSPPLSLLCFHYYYLNQLYTLKFFLSPSNRV